LDVSGFQGVLEVDPDGRRAQVLGMTTYERLVDELLPHRLMPLVVPELKTITLGGAVTGLGIESSSFRNGMPHESVTEMDILTGDGSVLCVRPDNAHADLYFGFPNSYGTLGYALRLEIELEEVHPYVRLRHVRFRDLSSLVHAIGEVCSEASYEGQEVAFCDATVFAPEESYLSLGFWSDHAPRLSDYSYSRIYYQSVRELAEDWLRVKDYLWRWDTDWFWCSRAFGAQHRVVRHLLGRKRLRSDFYWRVLALEDRYRLKGRLDDLLGRPKAERVVQDVQLPLDTLAEFLEGFVKQVPVSPFWLCPLRLRQRSRPWELYGMDPDTLYVNVGFWTQVPLLAGMDPDHHNRWVEDEVDRLGGRKSLYSTSFYSPERFWQLYNGPVYEALKERYDPQGRLGDLYHKCVRGA